MSLPLTALFVDCDSYFASVEQHLDPALRGRPVGVAPVMAESSCCIAASYEAKAFGVKTGTRISDARVLCPGIAIVESKPPEYIRFHHKVIAAVEDCIHVEAVLSIDEMWAWLPYNLREPKTVEAIGHRIKETVARDVSPVIKVSVGAGPNKYLAKMASKMRKPDGLFIIEHHNLPGVLHELKLRDFTGIGRSMELRLNAAGIYTVESLCAASKPTLHSAWNGVMGDRMWHLLRGDEIPDVVSARKSLGHSHVLPPDCRHPDKAWPILCKLLHKACERLRSLNLLAGSITIQLTFVRGESWAAETRTGETDSTIALMRLLERLWRERPEPRCQILQVGVLLTRLCEHSNHTPELFQLSSDAAPAIDNDKHQRLDGEIEFESGDTGTLHDVVQPLEFDEHESDPAEDAARNLDWESFLAAHPPRHRTAILVLVEGGTMREAGKRCGLKDRAALHLKRKIAEDWIEFFGQDVIRRLLDGAPPVWESDLRMSRDRHLSQVASGSTASRPEVH